jgi:TetR/AcrR family transcriptional regulator
MVEEYFNKMDHEERDLFNKLRQGALLKLELFRRYPDMYNFILAAYYETSTEVKEDIAEKNKKYTEFSLAKMYENIDISKFKEDVDVMKAMNIIFWTVEGYAGRHQEKLKKFDYYETNFNEMVAEIDVYFDMLKKCFYK